MASPATTRAEVIERIAALRSAFDRLSIRALWLFGSAGRDQLRDGSDVDMPVEFDGPARSEAFFDLKSLLDATLNCPIDLVTPAGLVPNPDDLCRLPPCCRGPA